MRVDGIAMIDPSCALNAIRPNDEQCGKGRLPQAAFTAQGQNRVYTIRHFLHTAVQIPCQLLNRFPIQGGKAIPQLRHACTECGAPSASFADQLPVVPGPSSGSASVPASALAPSAARLRPDV